MKYTTSFRNSVLKKILPPSNRCAVVDFLLFEVKKSTEIKIVT